MVDDLIRLWQGVQLKIASSVVCQMLIRAALVYISSDLPATRKICGFYGIKALQGCSKCLKQFPRLSSCTNFSGYDRNQWQFRDLSLHRQQVERARSAITQSARDKIEHELGIRHSELLRLEYFDIVRYHLVDPMHNLFLGTAKKMLKLWKDSGLISDSDFQILQERMDEINPPTNIGRLPQKIAAQFSGFTAEQWMLWTTLYSPLVLRDILPQQH